MAQRRVRQGEGQGGARGLTDQVQEGHNGVNHKEVI